MPTTDSQSGTLESSSEGHRRRRSLPSPPGWLAVGIALLAGFGPFPAHVSAGLDSSWQLGLSWARALGLRWGHEILFTYGPWGMVAAPVPLSASLMWQALAVQILALALVAVATWRLIAPAGAWWAALLALLTTSAAASSGIATAMFLGVALSVVAAILRSPAPERTAMILGCVAGLSLQMKFNMGCAAIAVGALGTLAMPRWRAALTGFLASSAAGAVVFWVAAGQRLVDFVPWLRGSIDIAAGYPSAMRHVRYDLARTLPPAVFGFALVMATAYAAMLWRSGRSLPARRRVALTFVPALAVAALYLATATRLDAGHLGLFPCALFALGLPLAGTLGVAAPDDRDGVRASVPTRLRGAVAACASIALVCLAGSVAVFGRAGARQYLHPRGSINALRSGVTLAASPEARARSIERQKAGIRSAYPVPPWELTTLNPKASRPVGPSSPVVAALHGRKVHVEPWAISAAWAHGLEWRPVPVMQTFSAYTRRLDEINASALRAVSGPEGILRQSAAIDGKYPFWESPRFQLAMLCNFEQAETDGRWQALTRVENRCEAPRALSSVRAAPGEVVPVPSVPGAIVIAELTILQGEAPVSRGRAVVRCGSTDHRLSQRFPSGPLVLRAEASGWDSRVMPAPCETIRTLFPMRIEFSAVAVQPSARAIRPGGW